MVVFENVKKEELDVLLREGFHDEKAASIYEQRRLRNNGITVILYTSGKLLLQGKEMDHTRGLLVKHGVGTLVELHSFRAEEGFIIGSDESLKGDTFGGIAVAAVKADDLIRSQLISFGVADSKKLSGREILPLAAAIQSLCRYHLIVLSPEEYNKQVQRKGITGLLNTFHKECGDQLKPGKHIVDEYPNCSVGDIITTKAESKYVEVAAASILARAAALQQMEELSQRAGFVIPLGSTHVREGLEQLEKKRLPFEQFVKMDFANVQKFLGK